MFDKYFPKGFTLETPRVLLEPAFNNGANYVQFNITDLHTKLNCGTARYNNISFDSKSAEISWNWINPDDADQGLIKNLKFAMLSYGFQVMKMDKMTMTGDGSMTIRREEWPSVKETFFPELM